MKLIGWKWDGIEKSIKHAERSSDSIQTFEGDDTVKI